MPESTAHALQGEQPRESGVTVGAGRLLQNRLVLVEDLWQTVLRSECPPEQSARLLRLKQLSDPVALEGRDGDSTSEAIVELIRAMDLSEAIAAARAFSLYFQLINILEQRIEEDSYLDSLAPRKSAADDGRDALTLCTSWRVRPIPPHLEKFLNGSGG